MSISVGKLKEELISTVVQDYIKEGFSFNKSQFSFTKKMGKNKVGSMLLFYNYSPVRVEYQFSFSFVISEIQAEKKRFYSFCNKEYKDTDTILLSEGDFHPQVKDEIFKFRVAFTHVIASLEKDRKNIEESREILRNEFFPRIHIFSDLKNFQDFILHDHSRVLHLGITLPSLIALKLRSYDDFISLVNYIKTECQTDAKDDSHIQKQMINNILAFANNDRISNQKVV